MSSGHNTAQLIQALAAFRNLKKIKFGYEIRAWSETALIQESEYPQLSNIIARAESIRFVRQALRAVVSAMAATQRPWDELQITPHLNGLITGGTLDLSILISPPSVTPILLESLELSCCVPRKRKVGIPDVDHVLGFIDLFSGIQRLVLGLKLGPNREGQCATAISQRLRLRLPSLRILCLKYIQFTEAELTALFLGHKKDA
ncbi:uncharacterized protein C8A04DRAFT_30949 [Dichotomopilus funicola]|uniref:Uncharacterized protein n=1 Tax=Dichotomopilus funicola TaxID=1934379 RepID=A0AAN6V0U9_9PEZI|nr:hypothetical protein C8A04DRAFT_30949 [Dichotomopilus funicola]